MQFPIAAEALATSGFGADRDGGSRRHKGNDILAPKMTPVVAVADGVVSSIHKTPPADCCWLTIRHNDGWRSLYVHLNNDTYLTDDGLGHGISSSLELGSKVTAGQVIGWVGDSGNAEATIPHIHFELRHPEGYPVDPAASLRAAKSKSPLLPHFGPYTDDDETPVESAAARLVTAGAHWSCDEQGLKLCPNRLANPAEASDLIRQLTGFSPPMVEARPQPLALRDILPQDEFDLVVGCEPAGSCFQGGITAGDLARLVDWANIARSQSLVEADIEQTNPEIDPAADIPLPDVVRAEVDLRFAGVIDVCHPRIDNEELLTRAEVVDLVTRWILGEGQIPCDQEVGLDRDA